MTYIDLGVSTGCPRPPRRVHSLTHTGRDHYQQRIKNFKIVLGRDVMMGKWFVCACVLVMLPVSSAELNLQSWSEQTYIGEDHEFHCNSTNRNVFTNADDNLVWRKRDEISKIETGKHYELTSMDGVNNMGLRLTDITEEMSGVYICDIMDKSGTHVNSVVKGLNLGGHKYRDNMNKYRHGIVVGLIAAAVTFVLLLSVCLIDRFQYRTDEQKQKRHERKQERVQQQDRWNSSGKENTGFDTMEDVAKGETEHVIDESNEANTNL